MHSTVQPLAFFSRPFWIAVVAAGVWINASEIFRYFVFIMPMVREAFPMIQDVAPINVGIFLSWMVWDTFLVFAVCCVVWLYLDRFGGGARNAVLAGTFIWIPIFVLLWLGLFNMNLATGAIIAVAWPLSWLEMVVAALLIDQVRQRF